MRQGGSQWPRLAALIDGSPITAMSRIAERLANQVDLHDSESREAVAVGYLRLATAGWTVGWVALSREGWDPRHCSYSVDDLADAVQGHELASPSQLGDEEFFCLDDLRGDAAYVEALQPLGFGAMEAVVTPRLIDVILIGGLALNFGWSFARAQHALDVAGTS